ncbi:YozQ family protein [Paenibacillus sp. R14(2021)]|uniref:YozQ family protein n=1 Tax=Paenibacillus sp. R14(2021) TaxID=2859228 RepID=UPI001C611E28|nr:YozQ family protein [Paenibacillus sp. R14(2021)]
MSKKKLTNGQLEGSALTHEMVSDVYMAGTSDGVIILQDRQIKVEKEGHDSSGKKNKMK